MALAIEASISRFHDLIEGIERGKSHFLLSKKVSYLVCDVGKACLYQVLRVLRAFGFGALLDHRIRWNLHTRGVIRTCSSPIRDWDSINRDSMVNGWLWVFLILGEGDERWQRWRVPETQ